jgi:hypothetical protein
MGMPCKFTELVIDCANPNRLAEFWAAVLGGSITADEYGCVQVAAGPGQMPRLTFVEVPNAKSIKNRLHIDLNPLGCTQAEEVERILQLGASRVDVGQGSVSWVVSADIEGNEFCVLRPTLRA